MNSEFYNKCTNCKPNSWKNNITVLYLIKTWEWLYKHDETNLNKMGLWRVDQLPKRDTCYQWSKSCQLNRENTTTKSHIKPLFPSGNLSELQHQMALTYSTMSVMDSHCLVSLTLENWFSFWELFSFGMEACFWISDEAKHRSLDLEL